MFKSTLLTNWLSRTSAFFSIVACYGTLAVIAMLGSLGVSLTLNEFIWAGTIIVFALISVFGLFLGLRLHHKYWPLLLGCVGTGFIVYVMTIDYHLTIEILGFISLGLAVIWDWKIRRLL